MDYSRDILKKAGIVNGILIVATVICKLFLFSSATMMTKIDSVVCMVALIFGLFYSLSGYKKDSAKYYKVFMILYVVSSIFSLVVGIYSNIKSDSTVSGINIFATLCSIAIIVCACILVVGKDMGEQKSIHLSCVILVAGLVKMIIALYSKSLDVITSEVSNLVLAIIVVAFVSAKYLDKASRGTK